MDTDSENLKILFNDTKRPSSFGELNPITEKIIGCAYTIGNALGCGFQEKVYENALAHELRKMGLVVMQQQKISAFYDNVEVGKYEADLIVEGCILVELKAVRDLNEVHKAQCMNYLKATGLEFAFLSTSAIPKLRSGESWFDTNLSVLICVHLWFQFLDV